MSFLHMSDCHAQLKLIDFREPSIEMANGAMRGNLPDLVGDVAHLVTLLKGNRPGALMLDGGDTWQVFGRGATVLRSDFSYYF